MPASTTPASDAIRSAGIPEILRPGSVALVGASPRNLELVDNVRRDVSVAAGVNPGRSAVGELQCVSSIADLDFVPDLGVIAVSAERTEQAVLELFERGTRAFVIPGLGAEAGDRGRIVASRLARWSADSGAAILGPNCMGIAAPSGSSAWLGTLPPTFRPGNVGVVSQSGSIADAFVALGPRLGFSAVLSTGAEISRDAADWVAALATDNATGVIGVFLESVRRPQAFRAALDMAAQAGKPVVALKIGRTDKARRTALAHTGAIVGSHAAYSAMLRTHGVLEVDDLPEMIDLLDILSRPMRPRGTRIGAVTESGAEAALLADHAEPLGFSFPEIPDSTKQRLAADYPLLPMDNPLDPWALGEPSKAFTDSVQALADSGCFDVLIAQIDLSRFRGPTEQVWCGAAVRALAEARTRTDTFAAVTTVHQTDPPDELAELAAVEGVTLLRGVRTGLSALARAAAWSPSPSPLTKPANIARAGDAVELDASLAALLAEGHGALSESDSSAILAAYGISFATSVLATTPDEAAVAVEKLGTPVVVKVDGVAHKARTNGVQLGVTTPDQARTAAARMGGRVLVASQVAADAELFCGMSRDPDYGPVYVIGHGGGKVESYHHVSRLGPLDAQTVHAMAAEAGLDAWSDALVRTVTAMNDLTEQHPQIVEIDVNPLMVRHGDSGAVAVDSLIVLGGAEVSTSAAPSPTTTSERRQPCTT